VLYDGGSDVQVYHVPDELSKKVCICRNQGSSQDA
jgi:hypothetical protein